MRAGTVRASSWFVPMRTEIFLPSGDLLILPAEMSRIGESGSPLAEPSTMAVHLRRTHFKSTLVPRSLLTVEVDGGFARVLQATLCIGLAYAGALARVYPKPSHTSAEIAATASRTRQSERRAGESSATHPRTGRVRSS